MLKTYTLTEFLLWHCLLFLNCPSFYYQDFSHNGKKVPGNLKRRIEKEIHTSCNFLEDQAFKCTRT